MREKGLKEKSRREIQEGIEGIKVNGKNERNFGKSIRKDQHGSMEEVGW